MTLQKAITLSFISKHTGRAPAALLSLLLCLAIPPVQAEASFNRFTDELTPGLEAEAISVFSRGLYLEYARDICQRTSAATSQALNVAAGQWKIRQEPYTKAASAVLNDLGSRHLAAEGEASRRAYMGSLVRQTIVQSVKELKQDFEGATPDNEIVPPESKCRDLAQRLAVGQVDVASTPAAVRELDQYRQRHPGATP